MKKSITVLIVTLACVFLDGCWDRKELNELAIAVGWGFDLVDNNTYKATAQFFVLNGQKTAGQGAVNPQSNFLVETGTGSNILSATHNMQEKLSRRIFAGHRKVIVIGEPLARQGLRPVLDEYTRNPDVRLRTNLVVVKGDTAETFLRQPYVLEGAPSFGVLKVQRELGYDGELELFHFLEAANNIGSSATLPVMRLSETSDMNEHSPRQGFKYAGMAIFNHHFQLVGFLNSDQALLVKWMRGELKYIPITVVIPNQGTVTFTANHLTSHMTSKILGNDISLNITLHGEGMLRENNTQMDLSRDRDIRRMQETINQSEATSVLQTVTRVQQQYKADIFGFHDTIHRKYPNEWRDMKGNWDTLFSSAHIHVRVSLSIRQAGLTGESLIQ